MLTFFHGWRRKLGVLTLVMACVFMAGWVRGLYSHDSLELRFQQLNVSLHVSSSPGRVALGIATGKHPRGNFTFDAFSVREVEQQNREQKQYEKEHPVDSELELELASEPDPDPYRSYLFGLVHIGAYGAGSGDFPMTINYGGHFIGTHYTAVVIPLILLSAWSLFSNPRVAKPKLGSEI